MTPLRITRPTTPRFTVMALLSSCTCAEISPTTFSTTLYFSIVAFADFLLALLLSYCNRNLFLSRSSITDQIFPPPPLQPTPLLLSTQIWHCIVFEFAMKMKGVVRGCYLLKLIFVLSPFVGSRKGGDRRGLFEKESGTCVTFRPRNSRRNYQLNYRPVHRPNHRPKRQP